MGGGPSLMALPGGDDFAPISIFNSAEDFSDTASLNRFNANLCRSGFTRCASNGECE